MTERKDSRSFAPYPAVTCIIPVTRQQALVSYSYTSNLASKHFKDRQETLVTGGSTYLSGPRLCRIEEVGEGTTQLACGVQQLVTSPVVLTKCRQHLDVAAELTHVG